ncbi:hypothetical protein BOX15_Mlig032258g2 [Macrostomum lignano]|uniref:Uncharacterized protein n=2 Tax=Macrostomum lignano TaxID=282301 RepID=A0A267F4V9_9PLAT|nr:hypothetical protein BOX15_Mlig032258g2 [Macrostomum lignano]
MPDSPTNHSSSSPPDAKRARLISPSEERAAFRQRLSIAFAARAARRVSEHVPTGRTTSPTLTAQGLSVGLRAVKAFKAGSASEVPSAPGLSISDQSVPLPLVPSPVTFELLATCCEPVVIRFLSSSQQLDKEAECVESSIAAVGVSQACQDRVEFNNAAFLPAVQSLAASAASSIYGVRYGGDDAIADLSPRWRCEFLRLLVLEAGCDPAQAAVALTAGDVRGATDLAEACLSGDNGDNNERNFSCQAPLAILLIRPPSLFSGGRLSVAGRLLELGDDAAAVSAQADLSVDCREQPRADDSSESSVGAATETFNCSYVCLPCDQTGVGADLKLERMTSGCQLLLQFAVIADGYRSSPTQQQQQQQQQQTGTPSPREDIAELLKHLAEPDFPAVRIAWALRGRYTVEQMARDGAAALQGEDRYVLRLLQEEWPSRVKLECFIALLQPDWRERRDSAYRRRRQLQQQQQQPQQAPESAATQATVPLLVEVAAADGDLNARDAAASLSQPMAGISAALAGATPPVEFLSFKHFYSLDGALFEYVCGMRVSELQLDRDELMNADADPVADAAAIATDAKQFALVAWPAERSFDLARGCGLSALVSLTLHFGRRCDPGLQVMMRCLLDAFASETDWPRLRRSLKVPADAELLRVLGQLDDASLANKFVGEVLAREMPASHGQMVCLGVRNVTTADRLYGLAARFGWPAMETSMLRLMRAVPSAHLTYLARWCPSLEAAVSACSSTALPQPLAVLLIRALESATSGAVAARDGNNNAGRGDNPTVRFGLQCLLACEHEGLCRRLVDFVNMSVANSASFIAKTLRSFLAGRSRQSSGGRRLLCTLVDSLLQSAESRYRRGEFRLTMSQEKWSYLSQRSFANENLIELVDFLHAVQSDELWQRFHRLIDSLGQQVSRSGTTDEERQHLQLAYSNLLRDLAERVLLNGFQADSRACRKLLELRRRQLEAANSCRVGEPEFRWNQPWIAEPPDNNPYLKNVVAYLRSAESEPYEVQFGAKTEAKNFAQQVNDISGKFAIADADGSGRQARVVVRKLRSAHDETIRRYYADLAEFGRLTDCLDRLSSCSQQPEESEEQHAMDQSVNSNLTDREGNVNVSDSSSLIMFD